MEAQLEAYDFTGVLEKYVEPIKRTARIFQHFSFYPIRGKPLPSNLVRVGGAMVGTPEVDYWVHPTGVARTDILVQVTPAGDDISFFYYGLILNGQGRLLWAYMNGHRD